MRVDHDALLHSRCIALFPVVLTKELRSTTEQVHAYIESLMRRIDAKVMDTATCQGAVVRDCMEEIAAWNRLIPDNPSENLSSRQVTVSARRE
jgi:hypothetical protein